MPLHNTRQNPLVLDFDLWNSSLWRVVQQGLSVEPLNVIGLHKIFHRLCIDGNLRVHDIPNPGDLVNKIICGGDIFSLGFGGINPRASCEISPDKGVFCA